MIDLYKLHWSHYVEKVIWALEYKGMSWRGVDIDPFTKREIAHLDAKYRLNDAITTATVPTIHDNQFDVTVTDSTSILEYLDTRYPLTAPLIKSDEEDKIKRWLTWLDSELGTLARRLGYTQVILEQPALLAKLFTRGTLAKPILANWTGIVVSSVVMQRFGIAANRQDKAYERAFTMLAKLAAHMKQRSFVLSSFSAVDITLAAFLRPLRIVPILREHPALQGLFKWQVSLFEQHGRDRLYIYETVLHEVRKARGWSLGTIQWLEQDLGFDADLHSKEFSPPKINDGKARNDHQPISRWRLLLSPVDYARIRYFNGIAKAEMVPG